MEDRHAPRALPFSELGPAVRIGRICTLALFSSDTESAAQYCGELECEVFSGGSFSGSIRYLFTCPAGYTIGDSVCFIPRHGGEGQRHASIIYPVSASAVSSDLQAFSKSAAMLKRKPGVEPTLAKHPQLRSPHGKRQCRKRPASKMSSAGTRQIPPAACTPPMLVSAPVTPPMPSATRSHRKSRRLRKAEDNTVASKVSNEITPLRRRNLHIPADAFVRCLDGDTHVFDKPGADFTKHLAVHGFAVLRGILGSGGTDVFCETFWANMAHIVPGLQRHDPTTWNFPKAPHSIHSSCGLPQADFAWQVRTNRRVQDAFTSAFGESDLVVSTDAVILTTRRAGARPRGWLHSDQSHKLNMKSYQGIYSLYGCGMANGGTVLIPGSHVETHPWEVDISKVINFVPVPKGLQDDYAQHAVKVCMPPDSLIVFSSRVLHCGEPGREDRVDPETGCPLLERIAIPVAFCPRARRSERTRLRKMDVYKRGLGSTHWPDDHFCVKRPSRWEFCKGLRTLPPPSADDMDRVQLL